MFYVITCIDKPDQSELRQSLRGDHRAWLDTQLSRVFAAGPLFAETSEVPVGSMLIVEASDRTDAEAFASADPYNRAELFSSVDIRRWINTVPAT